MACLFVCFFLLKFHSQNTFSRKKWKEPDGRFFFRNDTQHSPIEVVVFPISFSKRPSDALITTYKSNRHHQHVQICRKWTILFGFVYFVCVCVCVCCAHSIRSKYLIKIQYRLQNDRFVCTSVPGASEWPKADFGRLSSRLRVQTIFGAKLLLYSSMEFKVLVFY